MRWIVCSVVLLLGCPSDDDSMPADDDDNGADDDTSDDDAAGDDDASDDDAIGDDDTADGHPVGMQVPPFSLEDINPTSPTYGQLVSSEALAGSRYAMIFWDSRCFECIAHADGLFEILSKHPLWQEAQPLFGIESASAFETAPDTVVPMVENNDLPYLVDTVEDSLWVGMSALNHDFFAISAEGTLETWLPLYEWPDQIDDYRDYMTETFGP